jgi:hypothetical protein
MVLNSRRMVALTRQLRKPAAANQARRVDQCIQDESIDGFGMPARSATVPLHCRRVLFVAAFMRILRATLKSRGAAFTRSRAKRWRAKDGATSTIDIQPVALTRVMRLRAVANGSLFPSPTDLADGCARPFYDNCRLQSKILSIASIRAARLRDPSDGGHPCSFRNMLCRVVSRGRSHVYLRSWQRA